MHNPRRSLIVAIAVAVFAGVATTAQQPAAGTAKPAKLALVGGMLLDGYEAGPIHRAAVLIDGDRIVRVAPAAELTIPPDYTIVDTSGRTMMPGMIELHGHLIILGHGNYRLEPPEAPEGWTHAETIRRSDFKGGVNWLVFTRD